ncbi:MAG: Cobalt-precorrin-8 methylmutase, partial [uncultured Acidimicrobiales bacterium]
DARPPHRDRELSHSVRTGRSLPLRPAGCCRRGPGHPRQRRPRIRSDGGGRRRRRRDGGRGAGRRRADRRRRGDGPPRHGRRRCRVLPARHRRRGDDTIGSRHRPGRGAPPRRSGCRHRMRADRPRGGCPPPRDRPLLAGPGHRASGRLRGRGGVQGAAADQRPAGHQQRGREGRERSGGRGDQRLDPVGEGPAWL